MKLNIAVLPGDGIGPEIMPQAIHVLDAIAKKFGHEFVYHEAIVARMPSTFAETRSPTTRLRRVWTPTLCSSPLWATRVSTTIPH